MPIKRGKLFNPVGLASTSIQAVFTNPVNTTTFYLGFTLHNTNTTSEVVELYNVPNNSGSVGVATTVPHRFLNVSVPSNDTYVYSAPGDGYVHDGLNDTIQARTTTANRVCITPHGVKDV